MIEPWVQTIVTVVLAIVAAIGSALMTRSKDVERISALESSLSGQQEARALLEQRLTRIEDKIDRLIERHYGVHGDSR